MPTIKFSHPYRKLMDNDCTIIPTALLINVTRIDLKDLQKHFIDYDTDHGIYKLPKKGEYLMLIFLKKVCGEPSNLFTTLRRFKPEKKMYYDSMIGQNFNIEITQP